MKVTTSVKPSLRPIRNSLRIISISINPPATMKSTAAIAAIGMYAASGRTNVRIANNAKAEKTLASGVRAPAA